MNEALRLAFELNLDALRRLDLDAKALSTCLLAACSAHDADAKKQSAVIKYLIRAGVSVNETDKNGVTPLHRAVRFRSLTAVKVLLNSGAQVNAIDRRTQSTALHRAVTHSGAPATAGKADVAVAIVKLLLSRGADPTIKNKKGKAPTDYRLSDSMTLAFKSHGSG